ncbi:MAG: hypothetical protein ABIM96_00445 [Candidatus Saccharimonas sp.]
MIETLGHVGVRGEDTNDIIPLEVRDEIIAKIEAKVSKYIGSITTEELEAALQDGWDYGKTLVNGFTPTENILGQMARKICGIADQSPIDTDHYGPVLDALYQSARAGKRTLAQTHHLEISGEELATAV